MARHSKLIGATIPARLLVGLLLLALAPWAWSRHPHQVLILSSAHAGSRWEQSIVEGVDAALIEESDSIGRWFEHLDAYRFRGVSATDALAELYASKYRRVPLKVVVAIGGPALEFMRRYGSWLFPDVPVVFAGVGPRQAARVAGSTLAMTGVVQHFDYRATMDVALKLFPRTQRLVFISPDMRRREQADALLADYRPELDMEIWHDADVDAILARAGALQAQSVVVPLAEPGGQRSPDRRFNLFIDALSRASPAPVFSAWDVALGRGVVGGLLTDSSAQGRLAARMALKIAHGTPVEDVPVAHMHPTRLAFDARSLERFGLARDALPDGSEVVHERPSFYRSNPRAAWTIGGGFVVLTGLIAALLYLLMSRRRAERALGESEARLRSVVEHSPISLSLKDLDGRYVLVNRAFERLYGVRAETALGSTREQIIEGAVTAELNEHMREVLATGRAAEREYVLPGDDSDRTVLIVMFPVLDGQGAPRAIGSASIDISERKRTLEALAQSELRFQGLYDSAPDIYVTLTAAGVIDSVNRFGADYLGYAKRELEGRPMLDLVHPADRLQVAEELDRFFSTETSEHERKAEFRMVGKDGTVLWVHMRVRLVQQPYGDVKELRVICRDITDAHRLSEELAYHAAHDPLTGLVNRREFERRLGRTLKGSRGSGAEHALCYLDLDQFKVVNDTCGHLAGDELLRQLGALLRDRVRGRDVVARLGGDEFAVFMEHCPVDQALRIAEEIREAIEGFRFAWEDQVFSVGTSIGLVPVTGDSGTTVEVLSAADAACYVAKEQGRNRVHVYTRDSAELARHHGQMQWVSRIHRALDENEFELWCQPIVPVRVDATRQRPHAELLLRLTRPGQRPVLPGAFLPSAERFNLAVRVDRWVVATALEWLAAHMAWLEGFETCFVNLSGHSVADENFLDFVQRQFAHTGVPPERVCFEVTETAAIANLTRAHRFMSTLKDQGCYFALDDFGTGLSSFAHLKRLPVDFLKIDGAFVRDIVDDPIDLAMVRSINEIGTVMGKQTIAEYVETAAVLSMLEAIGVHYAQGMHLGRPAPLVRAAREDAARAVAQGGV